jgi:hypothetical protein
VSKAAAKLIAGLNQAVGYQTGAAAERAAIVAFMRDAIGTGYPSVQGAPRDAQCVHKRFYYEDCIGCYDEFLSAKLDAIEQGLHLPETKGDQ